ncbi:MAG: hypothetical protein NTX65_02150 [Ignavibacteriales bacterium]|nr:hypothetical protein [Ignavibacteriales bacterium]
MSKLILLFIVVNLFNMNAQVKDSLDTDSTWVTVPLPEINVDNGVHAINRLPKYIPIYEHKIYLYADFKRAKIVFDPLYRINELKFVIYLINNSADTFRIEINHLGWIRKEYRNKKNEWSPTKPCNWCYLSSLGYVYTIAPGEYFSMWDRFNTKGKWKKIRYSLVGYQVESSNEGYDRVELKEAEKAVYDELTFTTCTIEYLKGIINGDIPLKVLPNEATNIRSWAMRVMISRFKEKAIPFLEIIANTQDHILQNVAKDTIKDYLDGRLK